MSTWKEAFSDYVSATGKLKSNVPKDKKQEIFLFRAKEVHADRYDYSPTEYLGVKNTVTIICKEHGPFIQRPDAHLSGAGCPTCAKTARRKAPEGFISDAKRVHGDTFDYSLSSYTSSHVKVKIICKTHGIFEQTPANHLTGFGCGRCAGNVTKTTEEFIIGSKAFHGEKYDYSLAEYTKAHDKVKIICKLHGVFEQSPDNHLHGKGCPVCAGQPDRLYLITDGTHYKIGISMYPEKRLGELSSSMSKPLRLLAVSEPSAQVRSFELTIHKKHLVNPYKNERFDGYSEWRTLSEAEVLDIINTYNLNTT